MELKVSEIVVLDEEQRQLQPAKVEEIADSVKEIGLMHPITIDSTNRLIAGLHRLEAFKSLGNEKIPVRVTEETNPLKLRLMHLDENLADGQLLPYEESVALKEKKEIYEKLYPETTISGRKKAEHERKQLNKTDTKPESGFVKETLQPSFSEDTAKKTGKSKSVIKENLQIANRIKPETYEKIKDTEIAQKKTELLQLARLEEEEQNKVIEKIKDDGLKKYKSLAAVIKETKKEDAISERKKNIENRHKSNIKKFGLFNADSSEKLREIKENSVDLVVTDPPYAVDFKPSWSHNKWAEKNTKEKYLMILEEVCKELQRVCKPDAHLYLFSGWKQYPAFYNLISKYFDISNLIVWEKNNTSLVDFDKRYASKHEFILFCKQKGNNERLLNNKQSPDVLHYSRVNDPSHSCEKPVELLEYLINNSSLEKETVLDCFMGSGNTGVASIKNNRYFIGIELEKDLFDSAKKRVESYANDDE